jgi:uncharacterized protein (DUF2132 family)
MILHRQLFFFNYPSMSETPPDNAPSAAPQPVAPKKQANNPLHGLTLEAIVTALHAHYGWPGLAQRIPLRCFEKDPSVKSCLKLLRQTPWARDKVESLYLFMLREQRRNGGR